MKRINVLLLHSKDLLTAIKSKAKVKSCTNSAEILESKAGELLTKAFGLRNYELSGANFISQYQMKLGWDLDAYDLILLLERYGDTWESEVISDLEEINTVFYSFAYFNEDESIDIHSKVEFIVSSNSYKLRYRNILTEGQAVRYFRSSVKFVNNYYNLNNLLKL